MGWEAGLLLGAFLMPAQSPASGSEAKRMFLDRCQSCHVAPDPRFEVDRAWLDQVNRTA